MRIALGVEYNGATFCGWQSQLMGCAIQDVLERAIESIAQCPVRLHAAGRTDAGVHALLQVVHFDTTAIRPEMAWVRGVNAFLPSSVRVLWAKAVDPAFHARFSATGRHYQYVLLATPVAPAIQAGLVGWYHLPLDVDAMRTAIQTLLGEHDFSAFRASECQAKSAVKTLKLAKIETVSNKIIFHFSANAFLQHQVRNMVGALLYIGNGKHLPDYMNTLLQNKNRMLSPPTFSAAGLYLTGVDYDASWQLPITHRNVVDI